jgi:hypothetical protein
MKAVSLFSGQDFEKGFKKDTEMQEDEPEDTL